MVLSDLNLWAEKLASGIQLAESFAEKERYELRPKLSVNKIIFIGMGGSGIAGALIKRLLRDVISIDVEVIRSPLVPIKADEKTLIFITSYSGNTWETLEIYNKLDKTKASIIVIAHAGLLKEKALHDKLSFVMIPESLSPRAALGYFFSFICTILDILSIYPGKKIVQDCITHAAEYVSIYSDKNFFNEYIEKVLQATNIHIWSIEGDADQFAYRAQTQFNENSKVDAVMSMFPELAHNLLVGFTQYRKKAVILLCVTDFISENMKKALDSFVELCNENGLYLYKLPIFGNNFTQQAFNIILWSDFASYFLGIAQDIEVNPVAIIDQLKTKQKEQGISV